MRWWLPSFKSLHAQQKKKKKQREYCKKHGGSEKQFSGIPNLSQPPFNWSTFLASVCWFLEWKLFLLLYQIYQLFKLSSVQFSHSLMSDSLPPHEPQHARPSCPSPTHRVHPNPCPSSRWCHPTILSSVIPFSSCPQSFPASGSFPMTQLFAWGGQIIGVSASASVLPMNTQDWSPLGWTGWISLQSTGLSGVFSNTPVQKHQFYGAQLSL